MQIAPNLDEEHKKLASEVAKGFASQPMLFTADGKFYATAHLNADGTVKYYEKPDGKKFDADGVPYSASDALVETSSQKKAPDVANRYNATKDLLKDLEIEIQSDAYLLTITKRGAMVSTLTFSDPCKLKLIIKDKTLLAEKEGVTAKDTKGETWTSRKVMLDGNEVFAFFEDKGGDVANGSKPGTTTTGLTLLQTATLDIGKNGEILPHESGVLAKDRQGNIWESRKTILDGKEVFAFFQKEGAQATNTETNCQPAKAKALLPPFSKTLNGTHEVRVLNPNNFLVEVGVRSGDSGKDFEVRANDGRGSIFVPNGRYDIYFVYSDHPEDLYQGDSFDINGNGIQITITKVVNGNYGIRKVK